MRKLIGTIAFGAAIFAADLAPVLAAEMEPGRWRFVQRLEGGGRARQTAKVRCVRPAEAKNPVGFFTPAGRGCVLLDNSLFGSRVTARLRCVQGTVTSEVQSTITLVSPRQITASTTLSASSPDGRRSVGVRMTGQGDWIGTCRG